MQTISAHRLIRKSRRAALMATLAAPALAYASGAAAQTATVAFYHNSPDHAGLFTVPNLTPATVAQTKLDTGFNGVVSGVINAAPLYWHPAGATSGTVIVATETDTVYALNEATGVPVWQRQLGTAATPTAGCGGINPLGVLGTPVIDAASGTLYVDASVEGNGNPVHELFALSLTDGSVKAGYPVIVGAGVRALGFDFTDNVQEERGALALLAGHVFIPFGGYDGDCGNYHGVVASVSTGATPAVTGALSTSAEKGGIWAPGGIVTDGASLFAATGNTSGATTYAGGEAVVKLDSSLHAIKGNNGYFSPSNWQTLDSDDYDLGGVAPTLLDLKGSTPAKLVLALGKDGNAYLLDRAKLGGVGTALRTVAVNGLYTHTATARYTVGGVTTVAFNSQKPFCTTSGQAIVGISITAGSPPNVVPAWCTQLNGRGDPIVTTSDGSNNPIVWATGAEGDEMLHAYDGASGALLYSSSAIPSVVRHFSTVMVANGRLFVTSDNKVVAFDLP